MIFEREAGKIGNFLSSRKCRYLQRVRGHGADIEAVVVDVLREQLKPLVALFVCFLFCATYKPCSRIAKLVRGVDQCVWRKQCPQDRVCDLLIGQ